LLISPTTVEARGPDQVFKDRQISAADLAPAQFGRFPLVSGHVVLGEDGYGYGFANYGKSRREVVVQLRLDWRERGREKARRVLHLGSSQLGVWWSPTHQVTATVKDMNSRDRLEVPALLQLARSAVAKLRSRALPWPSVPMRLPLARDIDGYRLADVSDSGLRRDGSYMFSVTYATPERVGQRSEDRARRYRLIKLDMQWVIPARASGRSTTLWTPRPGARPTRLRDAPFETMLSRTHFLRIEIRGEYYDDDRRHHQAFRDAAHLDWGRSLARRFRTSVEQGLAAARGTPVPEATSPHIGTRPKPASDSARASGTVASASGRFMVIRGGRRVNVVAGGRVEMGDTIITSASGTLVIRFDSASSGLNRNGTLAIGPGSKVSIDVPPVAAGRSRTAVRVSLDKGALRFARPHRDDNPRVELHLPLSGGIFGLDGTDVLLIYHESLFHFAVLAGRAAYEPRTGRATPLRAGDGMRLDGRGTVLERFDVDRASYLDSMTHLKIPAIASMPVAADDPEKPAKADPSGPLRRERRSQIQRHHTSFKRASAAAVVAFGKVLELEAFADPADVLYEIRYALPLIEDALWDYAMLEEDMRGFPKGTPTSNMDREVPGARDTARVMAQRKARLLAMRGDARRRARAK